MSRSGALACIAALFAGLFTAGAASGAQRSLVGGIVSTATTTLNNIVNTTTSVLPAVSVPTLPATTTIVPTVSVPTVSVPTVSVPTVSVPTVSVPTVSVPTLPVPTPTVPVVDEIVEIVETVTDPVTGVITPVVTPPASGEAGGTVSGAVQGVTDALAAVTGALGGASGGSSGAVVPAAALNTLLTSVFGAASINPGDKTAPKVSFKVLNRLKQAARTGKLKIRVIASEPSVVALSSALRAGRARRVHGKPLKVFRQLLKTKATVLAFRKAGRVTATIKLPAKTRRSLANAQNARIALQAWAADVSRNQGQTSARRVVRR